MYKMLGVSDDVTTCECCGKRNLKRTVTLEFVGENTEVHYGTTCAAKALAKRGNKVSKGVLDSQANAVALANKWLDKGFDLETIGKGIGNRFGYQWQVRDNALLIGGYRSEPHFAEIRKPVKPVLVIASFYTMWLPAA